MMAQALREAGFGFVEISFGNRSLFEEYRLLGMEWVLNAESKFKDGGGI